MEQEKKLTSRAAFCASAIADARDAFEAAGVVATSEDIRALAVSLLIEAARRNGPSSSSRSSLPLPPPPPSASSASSAQPLYFATGPNGLPVCPAHGWEMREGTYGYYCSGHPKPGFPASKNGQYCGCQPPKAPAPPPSAASPSPPSFDPARQFEKDDLPF